ncbi:hypothetical protein MANES_18G029825v8 [Manihot esculenta]|uniref:Uncharacterized protein n=1 Tax=Manihot esculenta TaxID=3983 RepID=A0ACC8C508_MANES|nr:hypothetical protein MANES_18G029825v8 [Manihot esculenta]
MSVNSCASPIMLILLSILWRKNFLSLVRRASSKTTCLVPCRRCEIDHALFGKSDFSISLSRSGCSPRLYMTLTCSNNTDNAS